MLIASNPTKPQVAKAGYGSHRQRRRGVGSLLVGNRQQPIDLARIEAGQAEIVIGLAQLLEFQGQQFFVKGGPGRGSIHQQPERFDLSIRPLVTQDRWNTGRVAAGPGSQLARGL